LPNAWSEGVWMRPRRRPEDEKTFYSEFCYSERHWAIIPDLTYLENSNNAKAIPTRPLIHDGEDQ